MKLLIIEDERKIARALKLGFEQERAVVEIYYDGPSGLSAALGDDYDVIVLDRMLPGGKDGVQICEELRAKKKSNADNHADGEGSNTRPCSWTQCRGR